MPIWDGRDVFAQAETGSGKTGAFAIPLIQRILSAETPEVLTAGKPHYVVLSPTRELAQQTHRVFETFCKELGIVSACIIGGENIDQQKKILGQGLHILVGTPGRIKDLILQKEIFLTKCQTIVFDEADRLFDMGFKNEIEFILGKAPKERQLVMVSATSNLDVIRTAYKFHSNPEEIRINQDQLLVDNIDHSLAMVASNEKFPFLVNFLKKQEDTYAIVFCNTQYQTHMIAEWLKAMGFKASPISGRLAQNKRTKLLSDFREKNVTILVCTDVAARGLDIKNVPLVINYDLPNEAASYVHRIGRTGRAGEKGVAISLCAPEDCEYMDAIYAYIDAKIPKMTLTNDDFAKEICRRPYIDRYTLRLEPKDQPNQKNDAMNRPNQRNNRNQRRPNQPEQRRGAPQGDRPRQERAPRPERTERQAPQAEVRPTTPRMDKRFFEITTTCFNEAQEKALAFFRMQERDLLSHEVTQVGPKKFFFFGPQKKTYKFSLKPVFEKILSPFLKGALEHALLKLSFELNYVEPDLTITFKGEDEGLLNANEHELLNAFDHIIRLYLYQRIVLPFGMRIKLQTSRSQKPQQDRINQNTSQSQEAQLIHIAEKLKAELLEKKEPIFTAALTAAERRIIHIQFQDDARFKTSSIGDGRFKKIKIELV